MKRYLLFLLVVTLIASSMLLLVGCQSEDVGLDYGTLHDTYESDIELEEYEGEVVLQYNVVSGTTEFTFDESIVDLDDSYSFTVADLEGTSYDDCKVPVASGDNIFIVKIYFDSVSYSTVTDDEGVSTTTETATTELIDTHIINIHVLEMVTVTFYVGETVYHTEEVMEDSLLTAPAQDPTEEGNEFVDWVTEEGESINFNTYKVFGDTDIFASWTENVVTFELDGGTMTGETSVVVSNDFVLGDIETPTKEGYVFSGWCDDDGVYFDVTTEIIFSDVTLTAQWSLHAWSFEILSDDTVALTYVGEDSGVITVPTTYNGFVVSEIADKAFQDFTGITDIVIPEGIVTIGSMAFAGCTSLTEMTVPGTVTHIGDYAFMGCTSLKSVTLNDGLTNIGLWAFSYCSVLDMLILPASVTTVENYAFKYCSSLILLCEISKEPSTWESAWDAYGPDSVYYGVGDSTTLVTTEDAHYIISVSSGSYVATLIKYFGTATELVLPETIAIDDGEATVTALGVKAFAYNTTLESIVTTKTLTKVGASAFVGCDNLTIYAEWSSKPYNWDADWNISDCEVVWEYGVEE